MPDTPQRPPGPALRDKLQEWGIPQSLLADRCGITQPAVSQQLSGYSRLSVQLQREAIAEIRHRQQERAKLDADLAEVLND